MKIGILIAGGRMKRWQAEALRAIAKGNSFLIYDCTSRPSPRRPLAHAGYYALNLLAVRNPMTAAVEFPLRADRHIRFAAEADGAWERLPHGLLEQIRNDRPDVIVKFGMGLLRVPPREDLACPILSYHHGDPRRFRGRPAAFYELLAGEQVIGQIVQILSNRLDAGEVVAFAETLAYPHSWKQSLVDAYRASALLLPAAIDNALAGRTLAVACDGRNYRLPSNRTAGTFAAKLGAAKARRIGYGAFVEKNWRVAEADLPENWSPEQPGLGEPGSWDELAMPARYRFLADPFPDPRGNGVLLEAMRSDGRGEIISVGDGQEEVLPIDGGHLSYPATFTREGRHFILPEMKSWSAPHLFELTDGGVGDRGELDVPGRPRLLDATLHESGGCWFLFANRSEDGSAVLRLWSAQSPFGAFTEHPGSPIRISPAGGRMGGQILARGGKLYRPGQDLRRGYGNGLLFFAIDELSPAAYREREVAGLRFTAVKGPHTLNLRGNRAVFDYYDERFSLLAGFRRRRQSRGS